MSTTTTAVLSDLSQQQEIRTIGKMTVIHDDTELVRLLQGDETEQDIALAIIMSEMQDNIIGYLRKKGCVEVKAEAYFLEGLTKILASIENGKFTGEGSLEGYLKKTCRNTWLSALKSEKARKAREEIVGHTITTADLTADDLVFQEQRAILLNEFLIKLGAGCSEIMLLKADGYSSKEIVEMTDYISVSSVDRRYSVCMKKVRTLMKENLHVMNLLNELYEK